MGWDGLGYDGLEWDMMGWVAPSVSLLKSSASNAHITQNSPPFPQALPACTMNSLDAASTWPWMMGSEESLLATVSPLLVEYLSRIAALVRQNGAAGPVGVF